MLINNFDWDELGFDLISRNKSHLLINDLNCLGHESYINYCLETQLPKIKTFGDALGSLYVLEGATLGGQIIAKNFGPKFNLSSSTGLSFFTGYGELTGVKWAEFRNFANNKSMSQRTSEFDNIVIESAKDTFQKLTDWLCH
jgi:heme oxygenase